MFEKPSVLGQTTFPKKDSVEDKMKGSNKGKEEKPKSRKNTLGLAVKSSTQQKLIGDFNMGNNNMNSFLSIGKGNEMLEGSGEKDKSQGIQENKEDKGTPSTEKKEEKEKEEQEEHSTIKSLFSGVKNFFT